MRELIQFLGQGISADTLGSLAANWRALVFSTDPLVWLIIIAILRYNVSAWVIWFAYLIRRDALFAPKSNGKAYFPLVSVIVAGRNPGQGIEDTIRTCLDSGYPNVEILYADDNSTDGSSVYARAYEITGRVRVFANEIHSGKPTNLNIALMMARGELAFVLDADAEVEFGTIPRLVEYFRDPKVGAVTADICVRNASQNILTRLEEIEYGLNGTTARFARAEIGMLPILSGAASIFRMSAIRGVGGYDTGLGDDTDMTVKMLKQGWHLRYACGARIWTDQPTNIPWLLRQRIRWARNMVKIRIGKHLDLATFKYGWRAAMTFYDILAFRIILPFYATFAILYGLFNHFGERTFLLTNFYAISTVLVLLRALIANDIAGSPPLADLILLPIYMPYRFMLRTAEVFGIIRELLRIEKYHPYVPKRIWAQIPHW